MSDDRPAGIKQWEKEHPEQYPKKVTTGKSMDYSEVAFPKPSSKKKKKGWGKK